MGSLGWGARQKAIIQRLTERNIDLKALPLGEGRTFRYVKWAGASLAQFAVRGVVEDALGGGKEPEVAHACLVCLEKNGFVSRKNGVWVGRGTSTPWQHMVSSHKEEVDSAGAWAKRRKDKRTDPEKHDAKKKEEAKLRWKMYAAMGRSGPDKEDLAWSFKDLDSLAALVTVTSTLPDSCWEQESFRALMRAINPRWVAPRRTAIHNRAAEIVDGAVEDLKAALADLPIVVQIDEWVGRRCTRRYMGVGVTTFIQRHFFKLFLGVAKVEGSSTAVNIKALVDGILADWGIDEGNVIMYLSDSGANVKKALADRIMCDALPSELQADSEALLQLQDAEEDARALDYCIQTDQGVTGGLYSLVRRRRAGRDDPWERAAAAGRLLGMATQEHQAPLRISARSAICYCHVLHSMTERSAARCPVMAKAFEICKAILRIVGSSKAATEEFKSHSELALRWASNIRWMSHYFVLTRLIEVLPALDHVLLDDEDETGVNTALFDSREEMEAWKETCRRIVRLLGPIVVALQQFSMDRGPTGNLVYLTLYDLRDKFHQFALHTRRRELVSFAEHFVQECDRRLGDILPRDNGRIDKAVYAGLAFADPFNASLADELGQMDTVIGEGKRLLIQCPLFPEAPVYPAEEIQAIDEQLAALRDEQAAPPRRRRRTDLLDEDDVPEDPAPSFQDEIKELEQRQEDLTSAHEKSLHEYTASEAALNMYSVYFSSKKLKSPVLDDDLSNHAKAQKTLEHLQNRAVDWWNSDEARPFEAIRPYIFYFLSIPASTAMVERSFAKLTKSTGPAYVRRSDDTVARRFFATANREALVTFARMRAEGNVPAQPPKSDEDDDVSVLDVSHEIPGPSSLSQ